MKTKIWSCSDAQRQPAPLTTSRSKTLMKFPPTNPINIARRKRRGREYRCSSEKFFAVIPIPGPVTSKVNPSIGRRCIVLTLSLLSIILSLLCAVVPFFYKGKHLSLPLLFVRHRLGCIGIYLYSGNRWGFEKARA